MKNIITFDEYLVEQAAIDEATQKVSANVEKTDEAKDELEEGNEFSAARQKAIDDGKDEFEVGGKTYKVTGDKDSPSMASTTK